MASPLNFANVKLSVSRRSVVVALLALAVVAGLLFLGELIEQQLTLRALDRQQALGAEATSAAIKLGATLNPQNRSLDALAADPRVVVALSGPDELARRTLAASLQAEVPAARLLRLVPHDAVSLDESSSPPLTYMGLNLLRKVGVEANDVAAEVHLGGTPDEHIALVRRVPPTGVPLGYLHLAVESSVVLGPLGKLELPGRTAELRQPMPGGTWIVVGRSVAGPTKGLDLARAPVPGTDWQLALRGPEPLEEVAMEFSTEALVLPLVGITGLIATAVVMRRRRGPAEAAAASAVVYQGAIAAIHAGEYPGMADLVTGKRKLPPRAAAPVRSEATDANVHPGDVDMSAFINISDSDVIDLFPDELPVAPITPDFSATAVMQAPSVMPVAAEIFRTYDIRGIADQTLTPDAVNQIARAIGSEARALSQQVVLVARDGRNSSPALHKSLVAGLRATGCDVIDIGLMPTPLLYFATHFLDARTGVMLTGSHNPANYNGLKIVMDGKTLCGDAIQAIRRRVSEQDFSTGTGSLQQIDVLSDYIRAISDDIPVALSNPLRVVVDCGNAVPGLVAPQVLRALGHDVIELHCELDGDFPHHEPDPAQPDNLEDLILAVRMEHADLGLAFDGDGDRLGVVDRNGKVLWPDRQLMLFSRDLLSRNPGATVVYDVKCSRKLGEVITAAGGEPVMWRSGHSLIKAKMEETGALLGGEMTGHLFFKERWYGFDDAIYAAARLLEILINENRPLEEIFSELPDTVATPELYLPMPESAHAAFMQKVLDAAMFGAAKLTQTDGLRVDYPDRWGLIRPSNTTPAVMLRFEGDTEAALGHIQAEFRDLLFAVDPSLTLPF